MKKKKSKNKQLMFIQMLFIRNTTVYEKKLEEQHVYANTYSKLKFVVSCCAYRKVRRDFGFFSSVNHLSEGRVNANQTVTCLPSLAENDSRLLRNSKGNPNGEWIFLSKEGRRQMLLYSYK